MVSRSHRLLFTATLVAAGCPASASDADDTAGSTADASTGPTPASSSSVTSDPATTAATGSDATSANPTTTAASTGSSTAVDTSSGDGSGTGNAQCVDGPLDCGGTTWACGDEVDNDGDGLVDLDDPECTGPCDDDEASFQTGLPGDNMDCKQDCFWDGNGGQGDDGCIWYLRCDPANPGEFIGCEYTGGAICDLQPPNQDPFCIDFCEPNVPPGCDCFGCCEVSWLPEGPIWIFLNAHPDCALDNLEACTMCTPQIDDCGVPCDPGLCQICFGQTEPPVGCSDNECPPASSTCECHSDCGPDAYCYLGCCYPDPPG